MPSIPFVLEWTVTENELLALKDSVNGRLRSTSVFNIPSFTFYLKIYPNGKNDATRGNTQMFLHLYLNNIKKVEADRTFTIESANFSSTYHSIFEKSTGFGCEICKTDELFDPEKKYIVDGKLIIKVEGIFKFEYEDVIPAAVAEQKWVGGELGDDLWKKDDTKDFTIIVDGDKEIKVHKVVLDSRSDVFAAMLNSNMKEALERKMEVTDFQFAVVETGIKLIYHCTFTTTLTMDELMLLLQFFDKYNLTALKTKVAPFLINQISTSTVCRLANCSILTNSLKLKNRCIEFLMDSFASKTPLADFDTLDKDILFKIVKSSFIQIVETKS